MSEPLDRVCEYQPKGAHIPSLSISSGTAVSSIRDLEKAEYAFDDDEKALAQYIVPVLEQGVKTALANPPSYFTRFRVWYNPYRLVSMRTPSEQLSLNIQPLAFYFRFHIEHGRDIGSMSSPFSLCREAFCCFGSWEYLGCRRLPE